MQKFFIGEDEDELNGLTAVLLFLLTVTVFNYFFKDMVELLIKKFDVDRDGVISYEDYASVVRKQPLLLQFLGQCFPTHSGASVVTYCANLIYTVGEGDLKIA